jgi:hypothetical protein
MTHQSGQKARLERHANEVLPLKRQQLLRMPLLGQRVLKSAKSIPCSQPPFIAGTSTMST